MLFQRYLRPMIAALLVMMAASDAFALSGSEHAKEWNEAFGIVDAQSKQNIQPLWDAAQDLIDRYNIKLERIAEAYSDGQYASEDIYNSSYTSLKNNFKWFTWGDKGHRLMFHWGFNQNPDRGATPAEHSPLVRRVDECLVKYTKNMDPLEAKKYRKEQRQLFFKYIMNNMQAPRNKALIRKVWYVTGIPRSRGYANAVATILYDIHILADYTTKNTSGLQSIKSIEHDLVHNGFSKLLAGGDKTERLNQIEKDFNDAMNVAPGSAIKKRRAEALIDIAQKYLPKILHERFQNTLKARGIIITVPESE